jgi:hypothetical protein
MKFFRVGCGLGLARAVIAELSALNLLVPQLCFSFRSPDFLPCLAGRHGIPAAKRQVTLEFRQRGD